MIQTDLTGRVVRENGVAVIVLAVLAAAVAGTTGAAGVLAGGALALGNFWWLSGRAAAAVSGPAPAAAGWGLTFGLRFVALAAATAILLVSGWAHPVGLLIGLTVLPCGLIARGLADATHRS
jgi:hypothetical protein